MNNASPKRAFLATSGLLASVVLSTFAGCKTVGGMLGLGQYAVTVQGVERDDVRSLFFVVNDEPSFGEVETEAEVKALLSPDRVQKYQAFFQLQHEEVPETGSWRWKVLTQKGDKSAFVDVELGSAGPLVEFTLDPDQFSQEGPFAIVVAVHGDGRFYARKLSYAAISDEGDVTLQVRERQFVRIAE